MSNVDMKNLILDCQDCKIKEEEKDNETNSYVAYKCNFSNTRGLCVGGLNHGQFCGGNLDCPSKKHSDSTEDTVEYGLCVGVALDEGKVIPKNDTSGHGFGRGLERLLELFPAWFNTWEWKGGHYTAYTQDENKNNSDDYASFKNQGDYTYSNQTQFSQDGNCGLYPKEGCNPKANVYPKPPTVTNIKVNDQSGDVSGSGGILNAVLRFNASADHDQMPIVRMAVDWGDDSDPYVMQGWFKNRKALCGAKVCSGDLNIGCNNDNDCGSNKPCKKESHYPKPLSLQGEWF